MTGSVAMLEALLPADPDLTIRNRFGGTSLIPASERGHVDYVQRVLQTDIDVNHVNDLRWTALLEAVILGDGGPDLTIRKRFGGTSLIPASERGHVDYVQRVLQTDIDVNHVNALRWTALLEAVILGDGGPDHQQIVRLLLDAGADSTIADNDGITALQHAQARGHTTIAGLLSER